MVLVVPPLLVNILFFGGGPQNHAALMRLCLVWSGLAIGIVEELAWRGYAFWRSSEERPRFLIFVSALLFSLAHFAPGANLGSNIPMMFATLSVGLGFGIIRTVTGGLGWCMLLHGLTDASCNLIRDAGGMYQILLVPAILACAVSSVWVFCKHPKLRRAVPESGGLPSTESCFTCAQQLGARFAGRKLSPLGAEPSHRKSERIRIMNSSPTEHGSVIVREVHASEAPEVAQLLGELGYPATAEQVRQRLAAHQLSGTRVLVAECRERLVGLLSFHCIPLIHEDGWLGRITSLVVAQQERGRGVGRSLVAAAENYAWESGCLRVEVTSGDHRPDAHRFYDHLGYQLDCRRFIRRKPVA